MQVHPVSYQCSQLSTPESIMDVFRIATKIKDRLDHRTDVTLVVLDEVGLAEDSPTFPLKALHPLLEDGTDGSDHREQVGVFLVHITTLQGELCNSCLMWQSYLLLELPCLLTLSLI